MFFAARLRHARRIALDALALRAMPCYARYAFIDYAACLRFRASRNTIIQRYATMHVSRGAMTPMPR